MTEPDKLTVMDWVSFVTVNDTDYDYSMITFNLALFECKLCNALVKDRVGNAEYHMLRGEKPAP